MPTADQVMAGRRARSQAKAVMAAGVVG